jgi:ribosomal-protein-alanine N-acetyltransferase
MIRLDEHTAPILACIHAESIDPPWSEASFRSLLRLPTVVGLAHSDFSAFILLSVIEDEAEILTFATQQEFRRQGRGRSLLKECLNYLFKQKVENFFLEVNENNFAAIGLYEQLDFKKYGVRESYYINSNKQVSNALLMRRDGIK